MRALIVTGGLTALLSLAAASTHALAGSEDVVVEGAWSRASIGTTRPGPAYMTIRNTGDAPVALTGIATPLAMMSEIHETSTNAVGVTAMTPAGEIIIAPGGSVALEPGGLHVMLMQLQTPMMEGQAFPLTLLFDDGGEMTVEVPILSIAARGPGD